MYTCTLGIMISIPLVGFTYTQSDLVFVSECDGGCQISQKATHWKFLL